MTKRYLINEREAEALANLVDRKDKFDKLGFDPKTARATGNFPFRCKLLEAMGATTANKANSAIYFLGDTTDNIVETAYVVDDSSSFSSASSGDIGLCIASSEYHVAYLPVTTTASGGMSWKHGGVSFNGPLNIASSGNCFEPSLTDYRANTTGSSTTLTLLDASTSVGGLTADISAYYKVGFSLTARSTFTVAFQDMLFALTDITTSTYEDVYGAAENTIVYSSDGAMKNIDANIAVSALWYLTSGHTYNVRNAGTFGITVSYFQFWMERFST